MKAPITTAQSMSHPDVVLTINTLGKMADELRAENEKLREALERLARLGNEPHYGNSIGNDIARAALGGTK